MRLIHPENLEDLAMGAAVLGTGGGGDPYIGKLMAIQAIRQHGPVQLLGVDELADDALVVPSAMMGAPTVMVEKVPSGEEIIEAFKALQEYLGRKIDATTSIEAGGLNSTTPFTVAASLGIPLVDAKERHVTGLPGDSNGHLHFYHAWSIGHTDVAGG
ncbi:MAG: DUF917 family protein [Anaerolineae bacterium]